MTYFIILGKSERICSVDKSDYDFINQFSWHFDGKYARGRINGKNIRMHRLLLPNAKFIDHKDGDSLNNTRSNLRECTIRENCGNSRPRGLYKGVSIFKNKYMAKIANRYIGLYQTPEAAAAAYNVEAIKHFGEFAWLNKL